MFGCRYCRNKLLKTFKGHPLETINNLMRPGFDDSGSSTVCSSSQTDLELSQRQLSGSTHQVRLPIVIHVNLVSAFSFFSVTLILNGDELDIYILKMHLGTKNDGSRSSLSKVKRPKDRQTDTQKNATDNITTLHG